MGRKKSVGVGEEAIGEVAAEEKKDMTADCVSTEVIVVDGEEGVLATFSDKTTAFYRL